MGSLTRRRFTAAGALAAGALFGQQRPKEITSASVPDDPGASPVSDGTLPERIPFGQTIEFQRHDLTPRVRPFAVNEVRLLPGVFEQAQEANRRFLQAQDPDRLLHVFRVNAGLPSTAAPLAGWEKPDCELRGHFVGHYLSACALMHASTNDAKLKTNGDYVVAEFAKCQSRLSGGYLSAFPLAYFDRLNARTKVWAPFYTIHKIMAGLLDMYTLAGNSQALDVLNGMAAWTDKWTSALSEPHMQMVLDTEFGGMGETLYSLTALSGDAKHARVGDRFIKRRFANPLALRRDELRGLHANTHIPQVIAAARRYEISGDTRFRDVGEAFWQAVAGTRSYATGGTSNNEGWLVGPNQLAAELKQGDATNECCCSYNMLKLTRHLYQWSGDPRLFDFYERALLNHRLGAINAEGQTQYYLGVVPGSWRAFGTDTASYWCCTGSGTEEYAKLADSIYFQDNTGVYVNLFIASELKAKEAGLALRQETAFPEQAGTRITVLSETAKRWTLRIRIPGWIQSEASVRINGKAVEGSAGPGSYFAISRVWAAGDRVEVTLPMGLHAEPMADDANLRAILYGPLLLAGKLGKQGLTPELVSGPEGPELKKAPGLEIPSFAAADRPLDQWLQPGRRPLTFETAGASAKVEFEPFHKVMDERYSLYWRMS